MEELDGLEVEVMEMVVVLVVVYHIGALVLSTSHQKLLKLPMSLMIKVVVSTLLLIDQRLT